MKDISYFKKVDNLIDQLFYEGTINEGTLQVLSDIFDGLNEPENKEEFISQLKEEHQIDSSLESLKQYLDEDFKAWDEEPEDFEERLKYRFNIGESMQFPNVKEFLKDLNYEIMQGVLNGSITTGLKQTIPKELFGFLPLSNFEGLVEESIERFNEDNAEFDIEPSEPKEVEKSEIHFFNENFIEILIYFYETFGEELDFLVEIAFWRGYSVNEVKQRCNWHYRDRFRFKEERLNEKLLEATSHELSTQLWQEGATAADWWRKKAHEKNDDKNFLIFSENMVKFHLKEIRGSYILDCLKDLPLEEKARIIKEAKDTCEWFIK